MIATPATSPGAAKGPRPDFLVAGTDTEVGKTVISLLLLAALQERGVKVRALKPVESGCDPLPQDALMLGAVSGQVGDDLPDKKDLARLCPYCFPLPVAPQAAASAVGEQVEVPVIRAALDQQRAHAELVLVESAGGLGTPYGPHLLVMDLAHQLDLPVLLVARDHLGTIGNTVTALRALEGLGVRCAGVVLNRTGDLPAGPDQATNAPLIREHGQGVEVLGTLPFISQPPPPATEPVRVRAWARRHAPLLESTVDLDRLFGALIR